MDQWLDSLSEDWVSQPRSPHSDYGRRSSSAFSVASHASNTSQSRIPRYKPHPRSSLASKSAPSSKQTSAGPGDSDRKIVLQERSPSVLNIGRNRDAESVPLSGSPGERRKAGSKRHASTASVPSIPQDTIQHRNLKTSPTKENEPGSTPEWKRRVLQAKSGGTGPDLFGPIGLESIFRPPTVGRASKSGEKQKRGKKYQQVQVDDFPSSPPALPSEFGSAERSGGTDRRRSSLLKQMEILEEVSEGDSRGTLSRIGIPEPQQAENLPRGVSVQYSDPGKAKEDRNEILSQISIPNRHDNDKGSSLPTDQSIQDQPRHSPGASEATHKQEAPEYYGDDLSSAASPSSSAPGELAIPSLPDDLSTGTDLCVANAGFVNVRRGGYSNEGSFHRRPLSPSSSLPDFDAPELRSPSPNRRGFSAKDQKGDISGLPDQARSAPVTPRRKQPPGTGSGDEPRSSGSPLKLFDKYDTFTNNRLIRRISKFERSMHESEEEQCEEEPQPEQSTQSKHAAKSQTAHQFAREPISQRSKRRIDSFGAGQLDGYSFDAEHPLRPKGRSAPVVTVEGFANDDPDSKFRFEKLTVESEGVEKVNIKVDAAETMRGKRLPHSPTKESQAKRRRTLRSSQELKLQIHQHGKPMNLPSMLHTEANDDNGTANRAADSPSSVNRTLAGTKRKDARYDSGSQVADPRILALRQILRPRTPTPSQRGSQQRPPVEANQTRMPLSVDQSDGDNTPVRDLDHQTQALAGELANFTLNMAQDMTQGARKASVTTADFFNEAKQIMQLIRNQGRPQNGQAITEEEEPDNEEDELPKSQVEQSTIDELSRPPSREGGGPRRLKEPAQIDARVASHLRRFEDTDDLGLALPSSVKSMHITESHNPALPPDKSIDEKHEEDGIEPHSDPPNIRIIVRPQAARTDADIHSEQTRSQRAAGSGIPSSKSQSSGSSSNRSVPTGSSRGSRGSGTKAVIAPQVVSHLLSDNMGAMTFDHGKQVWVKRKGGQKSRSASHSRTGSDVTEDLFKGIPDLSVDEYHEQQRTQKAFASVRLQGSASDRISNNDHITSQLVDNFDLGPQTRDSARTDTVEQSSAPSKTSRFASSGPVPETRATSWGDEILARRPFSAQVQVGSGNAATKDNPHNEEVEHEISILEGRTSEIPGQVLRSQRQPRVVTVAFSSPLVDQVRILRDGIGTDAAAASEDDSDLDLADSPVRNDNRPSSAGRKRASSGFSKRPSYRNASRRASVGFARPMSRVDEHEELTFLQTFHGPQHASMELLVTTPLPVIRHTPLHSVVSSAQASSAGFQLSPLSEFTVHKSDELVNHDVGHVVKHRGFLATHEVEGKLSLAVQDLVRKLTDVEPYEPYWDDIRRLSLRKRELTALHQLDEFCGHLEDLDVSNNELSQLHGAPPWIRHLTARSNSLSSLTSWGHLVNLQYLDVSSNQIQSLAGFQSLVHLRELKANDNQIESLEGILELDGLIKLTLRNNCIKTVNLQACNL